MRAQLERVGGLRHKLSRVASLPALLRVLHMAVLVEWRIRRMPIRDLAARSGLILDLSPDVDEAHSSSSALTPTERRNVRMARKVLQRWPVGSGPCLRESLVVGGLLRHRTPRLRLGVAPDRAETVAHAWVEVGGYRIGYDRRFTAFQERRGAEDIGSTRDPGTRSRHS